MGLRAASLLLVLVAIAGAPPVWGFPCQGGGTTDGLTLAATLANDDKEAALRETILREIQTHGMCDIEYARRKAALKAEFLDGLTPANQQHKMAIMQAGFTRLNDDRRAWEVWRAARMKIYTESLAKLSPEERRAAVRKELLRVMDNAVQQMNQTIQKMQDFSQNLDHDTLALFNQNRQRFPQLGVALSMQAWQAIPLETRRAMFQKESEQAARLQSRQN